MGMSTASQEPANFEDVPGLSVAQSLWCTAGGSVLSSEREPGQLAGGGDEARLCALASIERGTQARGYCSESERGAGEPGQGNRYSRRTLLSETRG